VPLSQLSGKSDLSYPDCFHQCLYLLLEAGADPMINIDDENSTPLLIVIKRGSLVSFFISLYEIGYRCLMTDTGHSEELFPLQFMLDKLRN
jgi:hypothetical protein